MITDDSAMIIISNQITKNVFEMYTFDNISVSVGIDNPVAVAVNNLIFQVLQDYARHRRPF